MTKRFGLISVNDDQDHMDQNGHNDILYMGIIPYRESCIRVEGRQAL